MRIAIAVIVACAAAMRCPASESVDMQFTCPWVDLDGYTPFVVTLTSHAGAGRVVLDAQTGNGRATLAVDLPAETRVVRTVLVPSLSTSRGAVALRISGTVGTRELDDQVTQTGVVHSFRDLDVAIVDPHEDFPLSDARTAVKAKVRTTAYGSPKTGYYRGSGAAYADNRLDRVPAEALPDRWQGYPTWLSVLLTPAGEAELSSEQRTALAIWSGAGGAIFLTDERQLPAWLSAGARATVIGATSPALVTRIEATSEDAGFTPSRSPVPGTERVHVLGFVVLAALFAILVGPVNIWWVRRRNALHLFLITTPLISVATCVSLVVVGFLSEGLGVKRSATQFAILDQEHGRVCAWTGTSYFSGLSITRMAIDAEDKLVGMDPSDFANSAYYRVGPEIVALWGDGQRLSGPVVPARINRQLACVSVRPEKRRLILEREGSGWRVTNGLGCATRELVWLDATGAGWRCGALAPGAMTRLESVAWSPAAKPDRADRLGGDSILAWRALMPDAGAANVVHAVLDGAFVPVPGPSGADADGVRTELIGRLTPAIDAAGRAP